MKIVLRLTKVFIISMLTLWLINSFSGLDFIYNVLGVTEDGTKEKIVAGISTFIIGLIFELLPYLIKKYIADKINLSIVYFQKNIPVNKIRFKKILNGENKEVYQSEMVKIVFSLREGTAIGYWILRKLNIKLVIRYNPEQFTTIKKDGNIITNDDDDILLNRDSKGSICVNIFENISSSGEYSMDTELYIKPNHIHIDKSNLVIKLQGHNWLYKIIAGFCVDITNNKLVLKRWEG